MSKYCRCGEVVHPVRVKYNYKTCVSCSSVARVASAPITNHKTGNTIQIVSQEVADALYKAGSRKGYGTCLR
jgi:hypothetical protein